MLRIGCGGIGNELHVCLLRNDGRFFHAIRRADGEWLGFNDGSFIPSSGTDTKHVSCAGVSNGELQVCLVKNDNRFFHGIRKADGAWLGFNDGSGIPSSTDNRESSCAGVAGELQVCLLKNDGRFFHGIRQPNGAWLGFNDGSGIPHTGSDNRHVSCAGTGNELQVCLLKNDGRLFHGLRKADGAWLGFNDASGIPNTGTDNLLVSCAGVGNELHVCLVKVDGRVFHAIRKADGSWLGFNDASFLANASAVGAISSAGVGGELQVSIGRGTEGFFHALRKADGSWNGFNDGSYLVDPANPRPADAFLDINLILVANDLFTAAERKELKDALAVARSIYAKVGLSIREVAYYGISSADAGDLAVIDSNAEATDLTQRWTVDNGYHDVFIVRSMNGADGWSAVNGSCDKNAKGMNGSVVSLNGDKNNSGNSLAHEIGHYLGLDHIADSGNFIGGSGASDSWTGIYDWQGDTMKKHCFIRR